MPRNDRNFSVWLDNAGLAVEVHITVLYSSCYSERVGKYYDASSILEYKENTKELKWMKSLHIIFDFVDFGNPRLPFIHPRIRNRYLLSIGNQYSVLKYSIQYSYSHSSFLLVFCK